MISLLIQDVQKDRMVDLFEMKVRVLARLVFGELFAMQIVRSFLYYRYHWNEWMIVNDFVFVYVISFLRRLMRDQYF